MMFNTDKLSQKLSSFADAALIFSEENRRYFTRFSASDSVLLVTENKCVFFTDSRYTEAAEKAIGKEYISDSSNLYESLEKLFKDNGIKKVAVENDRLTLGEFQKLREKLPDIQFVTSSLLSDAVNSLRDTKSDDELANIKAAQKIAEDAFSHILSFIRPGISEKEIALELDFYMLSHGAEALSFETIAVGGKNSSMPHGVPGNYLVQNGDFITMDYGAVVNGYHSDMTRTVALGQVSSEQKEIYETVLKAQLGGLESLKSGIAANVADTAARDIIRNAGYGKYFGHSFGHGVGIEIHEKPSLSPKSEYILKTGNVVTAEPGIYIPDKFGVRIEDMAYITENGCINLTSSPKELIIL